MSGVYMTNSDQTADSSLLYSQKTGRKFEIISLIGEGQLSKVYTVKKQDADQMFAAKLMHNFGGKAEIKSRCLKEISFIRDIAYDNRYLLKYHDECETNDGHLVLITDLCFNSLISVIQKIPLEENQILTVCCHLLQALNYLHCGLPHRYIHCDIKVDNLLLSYDAIIKLCDFGSVLESEILLSEMDYKEKQAIKSHMLLLTTPIYRAPEIIDIMNSTKISQTIDIWAFGCVLYTLMFSSHPFYMKSVNAILSCSYSISSENQSKYSKFLLAMIDACIEKHPNKRPISEILLNDFLNYTQRNNISTVDLNELIISFRNQENQADEFNSSKQTINEQTLIDVYSKTSSFVSNATNTLFKSAFDFINRVKQSQQIEDREYEKSLISIEDRQIEEIFITDSIKIMTIHYNNYEEAHPTNRMTVPTYLIRKYSNCNQNIKYLCLQEGKYNFGLKLPEVYDLSSKLELTSVYVLNKLFWTLSNSDCGMKSQIIFVDFFDPTKALLYATQYLYFLNSSVDCMSLFLNLVGQFSKIPHNLSKFISHMKNFLIICDNNIVRPIRRFERLVIVLKSPLIVKVKKMMIKTKSRTVLAKSIIMSQKQGSNQILGIFENNNLKGDVILGVEIEPNHNSDNLILLDHSRFVSGNLITVSNSHNYSIHIDLTRSKFIDKNDVNSSYKDMDLRKKRDDKISLNKIQPLFSNAIKNDPNLFSTEPNKSEILKNLTSKSVQSEKLNKKLVNFEKSGNEEFECTNDTDDQNHCDLRKKSDDHLIELDIDPSSNNSALIEDVAAETELNNSRHIIGDKKDTEDRNSFDDFIDGLNSKESEKSSADRNKLPPQDIEEELIEQFKSKFVTWYDMHSIEPISFLKSLTIIPWPEMCREWKEIISKDPVRPSNISTLKRKALSLFHPDKYKDPVLKQQADILYASVVKTLKKY
ncbi:MAG: hypothetical protein MHMPM18_001134 [Marteilia pararefringens]